MEYVIEKMEATSTLNLNLISLLLITPWIVQSFQRISKPTIYKTFKKCLVNCNAFRRSSVETNEVAMDYDDTMEDLTNALSALSISISQYLHVEVSIDEVSS